MNTDNRVILKAECKHCRAQIGYIQGSNGVWHLWQGTLMNTRYCEQQKSGSVQQHEPDIDTIKTIKQEN